MMKSPEMGDPYMDYPCNWRNWKLMIVPEGMSQAQLIEAWDEIIELDQEFF